MVREGWTITHDPLRLTSGRRNLYVDLGAERLLAAEKGTLRIAVEVKMFSGPSDIISGKLWIQHDGTERGVARDLEAAGIPRDRIVLAFQHISRRRYGDYAAA